MEGEIGREPSLYMEGEIERGLISMENEIQGLVSTWRGRKI
jgi:hypothetical protein